MATSNGFYWSTEAWGLALRSRALLEVADHFFTSCHLQLRGDREVEDWRRVAKTIGVPTSRLLRLKQVHGRRAVVARAGDGWPASTADRPRADIVLSDDPSCAVVVQVADCVPLLMADRVTGAVAAVHAGWRGTLAAVGPAAVAALRDAFGTRPGDLVVAQGPSVGACCYQVGEELVEAFKAAGFAAALDRWFSRDADGILRLDLWIANRDQLVDAGVRPGAIHQANLCTASHPELFPSYRRDGPGTGRIAAVVRPRPAPRP
jgi:hypothetical protein